MPLRHYQVGNVTPARPGVSADTAHAQCQEEKQLFLRSGSGGFQKLVVTLDLALIPTMQSGLMSQPFHSGPSHAPIAPMRLGS